MIWEVGGEIRRLPASIETPVSGQRARGFCSPEIEKSLGFRVQPLTKSLRTLGLSLAPKINKHQKRHWVRVCRCEL